MRQPPPPPGSNYQCDGARQCHTHTHLLTCSLFSTTNDTRDVCEAITVLASPLLQRDETYPTYTQITQVCKHWQANNPPSNQPAISTAGFTLSHKQVAICQLHLLQGLFIIVWYQPYNVAFFSCEQHIKKKMKLPFQFIPLWFKNLYLRDVACTAYLWWQLETVWDHHVWFLSYHRWFFWAVSPAGSLGRLEYV